MYTIAQFSYIPENWSMCQKAGSLERSHNELTCFVQWLCIICTYVAICAYLIASMQL